jgi:valyl-tRNA synthetase
MNLSLKKVEANRNFANKVWNAARFVIMAIQEAGEKAKNPSDMAGQKNFPLAALLASEESPAPDHPYPTLADAWIHARLRALIREVDRLFQNYYYGEAGRQIYDFFWSEFADWYIETAKLQLVDSKLAQSTARTLVEILDACLRLLHPFTPFVTEEAWRHLRLAVREFLPDLLPGYTPSQNWEEALIIARWPEPSRKELWEDKVIFDFSLIMDMIRSIRNLRAERKVAPGVRLPAIIVGGPHKVMLRSQTQVICSLAKLKPDQVTIVENLNERPDGHIPLVVGAVEIHLPLTSLVDLDEERARLEKDLKEALAQVERLETLLAGPFKDRAPRQIVENERAKLETYREKVNKLKNQLSFFGPELAS